MGLWNGLRRRGEYKPPKEMLNRQQPAVHHRARHEPLRGGAQERRRDPHQGAAAAPDDAGQDRALMGEHLGRIPAPASGCGSVTPVSSGSDAARMLQDNEWRIMIAAASLPHGAMPLKLGSAARA